MAVAESCRRRDRSPDRLDEIRRALERALLAAARDSARNRSRIALFAEALEDRRQVALVRFVDDSGGGDVGGRIHPHVERGVHRVRESPVGSIDLHRRDAEVEQDDVGFRPVVAELAQHDGEVAAEETSLNADTAGETVEVLPRDRVTVDRDQLSLAAKVLGEQRRVAARAEGRVDDGLAGLHGEEPADLVGKDGNVVSRVWLQGVRQHPPHSLPSLRALDPTRRGPKSPGGRRLRR